MKKLYFSILILLICVIIGVSVYNKQTNIKETLYAFDTVIELNIIGKDANEVVQKSIDLIKKCEKEMSAFKQNSDVSLLNSSKKFKVSKTVLNVIKNAVTYSEMTNGNFDITVKSVVDLWNITNTSNGYVPTDEEINENLKKVGYKNILFDNENVILLNSVSVDLGAIAKGYCANEIKKIINEHNIKEAVINIGGNIYVLGNRLFKIGLQNPDDVRGEYFGVCTVKNTSVVTSGAYERYFEKDGVKYHHIINPHTGKCADKGLKSVTIIGENSEKCDAFSTAVYVMGKDEGIKLLKNETELGYVIVDDNNNVYVSENVNFKLSNESYKIHKVD